MLEHKAAIKNCFRFNCELGLKVSLLTICIALNPISHAAQKKNSKTTQSKTLGDVLNSIKDKKLEIKKNQSSLPSFNSLNQRKQVNLNEVKPPVTSSFYYDSDTQEAELEKVTDDQINQLFSLTKKYKKSKRRGELWLRLAELYVEKSRLLERRILAIQDKKNQENEAKGKKVSTKLNLTPALEFNKKAIQLYEWFLRDFPKDEKVDQALFFLGYNYFELGDQKKGMFYYQRLTNEFPKSPFVDESNFAIGEFYFENEQWKSALPYYQKVSLNKRARLYSFSLYKSAWCQYKLGAVKDGLRSLELVIRAGRVAKGNEEKGLTTVSRIRLATESLRDLVIFYAEVGSYENAKDYFAKVAGVRTSSSLLEKLAYYYADTGQKKGARYLFHDLIQNNPSAPKAYDYQYQIVTMFVSSGSDQVFKQELYNWIQGYGPGSSWQTANKSNSSIVEKATQLIETTLRNYILQQHQTAQNSRTSNAQDIAKSGYELYFRVFKESPKLDEMHFFYGELLFDMKEYGVAADQYLWVAEKASTSPYFSKSVMNSILSLEKKLPSPQEIKNIVGKSTEPVEFDSTIKKFEWVVQKYLKNFPVNDDSVAIQYRLASLYYYYNQYDQALVMFKNIMKSSPSSKYAEYSSNLTLDIFNIKQDFDGLESAGLEILQIPELAKSSVGQQVRTIVENASFKKAQNAESKKDYLTSAQKFEEFAFKNPTSNLALSARFNSAVNFERAGDLFKSLLMYNEVLKSPGKDANDLKKKSFKYMAILFEKTGQYKMAADFFEKYANENSKTDKEAVDFFYNAGIIRDGLNFYESALDNYQKYFDKSKKRDRIDVVFLMAKIWERRGNLSRAKFYYKQYIDLNPSNGIALIESLFRVAQIELKSKKIKFADDYFRKVISVQRAVSKNSKRSVGISFAAEAQFNLVYRLYEELLSVIIPKNPAAQSAAVQKKLDLLNKLKDRLKTVIQMDDAYMIIASLVLSGQASQHMSASLYNAPLPKGLKPDQIKEYKAGVEKLAQPFQTEAVKSYEAALQKGFQLESYNHWMKIGWMELSRLNPESVSDFGENAILTKVADELIE